MQDIDRMIGEYTERKIYFIKQNGEQLSGLRNWITFTSKLYLYCLSSPSQPFLVVLIKPYSYANTSWLIMLVDYFSKDDWSMFKIVYVLKTLTLD